MFNKFNYLRITHLSMISFFCGSVLFDINQFSNLFFDTYIADAIVTILLFIISLMLFYKYLRLGSIYGLIFQGVFILSTVEINVLKDIILIHTGLLEFTKYCIVLLSALCLSIVLKQEENRNQIIQSIVPLLFIVLGVTFSSLVNVYWLKVAALLDTVILLFVFASERNRYLTTSLSILLIVTVYMIFTEEPSHTFPNQKKYHDRIVFSVETPFQKIDITKWKGDYWVYADNIIQFSTLDEQMYYEPFVHPAIFLATRRSNILVIGGENGIILRELKKHQEIRKIDLVALDTGLLAIAKKQSIFTSINEKAFDSNKVNIYNSSAFNHLNDFENHYDLIIIDTPDPVDLEVNRYFSIEFYELCFKALTNEGIMVTQAGSPYYATKAFQAIYNTIERAGFSTLPFHNQVVTMGEWGWVIGSKSLNKKEMKKKILAFQFKEINTKWINNEAMRMMLSFGKPYVITDSIQINRIKNPVIHEYYTSGTWNFD